VINNESQIECIQISSSSIHRFVKLYVPHALFYILCPLLCLSFLISPSSYGTAGVAAAGGGARTSASLLLAAVHCPSLTHARTMSVFAVPFCQPMSFPGVKYSVLSHSSSGHA